MKTNSKRKTMQVILQLQAVCMLCITFTLITPIQASSFDRSLECALMKYSSYHNKQSGSVKNTTSPIVKTSIGVLVQKRKNIDIGSLQFYQKNEHRLLKNIFNLISVKKDKQQQLSYSVAAVHLVF